MADTGLKFPTANAATGSGFNLTNPNNLHADDTSYVTRGSTTSNSDYSWSTFAFGVPGDAASINGIEVVIHCADSFGDAGWDLLAALSHNNATNYTADKTATNPTNGLGANVFTTVTLGGASDTWGRTWAASEFSDANFRLRLTVDPTTDGGAAETLLDYAQVRVYYTPAGGGVTRPPTTNLSLLGVG